MISARRVEVVVAVVVGGCFGLSAGGLAEVFFVGRRRRVQTDVISRDCFHEVGEKGKNLRLEKCRKMNQNKSRLVLVSFYFLFNFFFFFRFYGAEVATREHRIKTRHPPTFNSVNRCKMSC